jgi:hypothetical protein
VPQRHDTIFDVIRSRGYAVSEHHLGYRVEMHAVLLVEPYTQHIAFCSDGDGPAETVAVARQLADMVGVAAGGDDEDDDRRGVSP